MADSLLLFSVGALDCALSVSEVKEVVHLPLLTRPPVVPDLVQGVLNLRGAAVPVIRLDRLFGIPEEADSLYTPLIVLRESRPPLALLVQAAHDVAAIDAAVAAPVPEGGSYNGCVKAVLQIDGRRISVLSVSGLLAEEEKQRLAEFQSVAASRLAQLAEGPE